MISISNEFSFHVSGDEDNIALEESGSDEIEFKLLNSAKRTQ